MQKHVATAEHARLAEIHDQTFGWRRWGPYVSERSWATVREDYSLNGDAWAFLPHDLARSKAYRWGEDGIAGICDRYQILVFAPAFWNGRDPILKERLFGLTPHEGNHGEDVKEYYFHVDNTPTHSYMKYVYKYPHAEFPYRQLIDENRRRAEQRARIRTARHRRVRSRTAISTSPSNTRRPTKKTSACGSRRSIAVPSRRRCT